MEKIALKAAKIVDGEILGLDLMETDNGYLIQEINHTSGFKAASWTTGTDIAGRIIEYLIKECKKWNDEKMSIVIKLGGKLLSQGEMFNNVIIDINRRII